MASLENRAGHYRIIFRYGGTKYHHKLGKVPQREASSCLNRLEENLRFLERGLLEMPEGADLGVFLLSGGKLNHCPVIEKRVTVREFFDHYRTHVPEGAKEANTRYTENIHLAHLERLIGAETALKSITTDILQAYVDVRSKERSKFQGLVTPTTIKKELGTFASVWNKWGVPQRFVAVPAPTKGLLYGKTAGKPPFQTREQIERQIARGGLTPARIEELWDCLFLTLEEVEEVLREIRCRDVGRPFLYPMFVFAAHTGARRSEMIRSQIDDFDFENGVVTIREKKKDRSKDLTFRSVPMTPLLRETMKSWFVVHPGGQLTVCEKAGEPISVQRASQNFRRVLKKSKWSVLSGWHVFRHSFASNCARKGLDQRVIDEFMGHTTEDMRRRYRHLFPEHKKQALALVFG